MSQLFFLSSHHITSQDESDLDQSQSLLQLGTTTTERVEMLSKALVGNPLASALGPIADTMGPAMTGKIDSIMNRNLVQKMVVGLQDQITQRLVESVSPRLGNNVFDTVSQAMPDKLVGSVPGMIDSRVTESVPPRMVDELSPRVTKLLSRPIPEDVESQTPANFIKKAAPEMCSMLTKSLASSIVSVLSLYCVMLYVSPVVFNNHFELIVCTYL
jgi:hypothetical protein